LVGDTSTLHPTIGAKKITSRRTGTARRLIERVQNDKQAHTLANILTSILHPCQERMLNFVKKSYKIVVPKEASFRSMSRDVTVDRLYSTVSKHAGTYNWQAGSKTGYSKEGKRTMHTL
jgi:hypothetical protein